MKYLLFLLLLLSCAEPKVDIQSNNTESSVKIQISSDWKIGSGLNLSAFVDKIEFVPLELSDSCLLHGVERAEITEEFIYVADDPSNRSSGVYQFDRKGNFIRQIGSKGEGPEDFIVMDGFTVNEETGEIYIYDVVRKRVVKYFPDGTFSGVVNLRYSAGFFEFKNDFFYLYDPYPDSEIGKVKILNASGKIEAQYLKRNKYPVSFGDSRVTTSTEGEVLCFEEFNDTVYVFHDERIYSKYIFDFGEYTMPNSVKNKYFKSLADERPLSTRLSIIENYISGPKNVWETKERLFFTLSKGHIQYHGLYNKVNKQTYLQTSYKDDLYSVSYLGDCFVGTYGDGLIACKNSNVLRNALEKHLPRDVRKGKLSAARLDSLTAFFSQYIPINKELQQKNLKRITDDTPKTLSEALDDMYGSSGEELNPMLMIIQFKE